MNARPRTLARDRVTLFELPNGQRVADPVSRFQPEDVSGPSEVIAPGSFLWKDTDWGGRAWDEAVLYELHIGAFTPEGTFLAAIGKLDHLQAAGGDGDRADAGGRFCRQSRLGL